MATPYLPHLPLGLLVRSAQRAAFLVATPVLLFAALFVLISDETNYVMRFRYPVLPVLLVGLVPVAQALVSRLTAVAAARRLGPLEEWLGTAFRLGRRPSDASTCGVANTPAADSNRLASHSNWFDLQAPRRKLISPAIALVLAASLAFDQHRTYRYIAPQRMGLHELGLHLHKYARRGFSLVTTEAGLLPFYSEWRAVDAWGLNDSHIAHSGGVDAAYLDRYRPEIITFHAYFSPGVPDHGPRVENRSLGLPWYRMVMTLKSYAESRGYVLAACFGRNAWDTHYYYVRTGFPYSAELVAMIRGLDYAWDGEPTVDFAAEERESRPE
jgi:hypothetical protein